MDPSVSGGLTSTQLDLMASMITYDPPPHNPKDLEPSLLDIDAFMNQPRNVILVNVIIDRNRGTIMESFQRDIVGGFGFERPPPLEITYPTYPLFGKFSLPNHFSYLKEDINQ